MASPIFPPLFLSSTGDPPILWSDWKLIFQAYADTAGEDATKPKRRKALLLNALGHAGLKLFYTLNATNASASTPALDMFQDGVALFNGHFKDASCDYIARLKFQERRQFRGEPVTNFITSPRTLPASCGFSALENDMLRHQLFTGIASQNVHCRILQKGAAAAFRCGGPRRRFFVSQDASTWRPFFVSARRSTWPPVSSLSVAANMAAPPLRGGEEAVKMATPCRQIQSFRINIEL
ncbi:hypothetical protein HPB52_002929 [Rhipicephalus sanguineus]|uniref:Uncharacterized protein n=1 Tax=Rhipicephalus sanguineus TaxID=34632 RepID=A0A9D4QGX0_RHISA|nr:hypothetical protein HPB52_002929 [Rhipicephalus sanguineus]